MNRAFTFVSILLLTGTLNAQNLFECQFSEALFPEWLVVDANEDGKTWALKTLSEAETVAHYPYHSSNRADDWLISPPIPIPAPGCYKVSFDYMGSSFGEKMDVFYGNAPEVSSMDRLLLDMGEFRNTAMLPAQKLVWVEEAGDLHLGFHAKSDPDKFRIYVNNIVVAESSPVDIRISQITAPATGTGLGLETVTVNIKNEGYVAVSDIPLCYTVNGGEIVRETFDGTIAAGDTRPFTFSAKADLSAPRNWFHLKAWSEAISDAVPSNDTCMASVRHIAPATAPYFMGFEPDEEVGAIAYFNLNEDSGDWGISADAGMFQFSRTGLNCMMYSYDKENSGNDWFILEGVILEPGYYSLKFWYSGSNDHPERLGVYYGTGQNPDAMDNLVVEHDPFNTNNYVESASTIHIEEAGTYYLGFKSFSDKDENIIVIDDISLTALSGKLIDLEVSNLANPRHEYVYDKSNRNIEFSICNNGVLPAADVQLNVLLNGKTLLTESVDLAAQETRDFVIPDGLADLWFDESNLQITLTHPEDMSEEGKNTLSYRFRGFTAQAPFHFFDYEEGVLPEGSKVVVMDNATVNSNLEDLFPGGVAWNTVEINEHALYGHWMLGGASYLSASVEADRWFILPQLDLTNRNAHFIWTATSMDPDFPEKYEVLVSDKGDDIADFEPVMAVDQESPSTDPAVRGVSLTAYSKPVYIAFRLRTTDGFVLTLDNMGVYGDITQGVVAASSDREEVSMRIAEDVLVIGGTDVESLRIYSPSGALMMSVEGRRAELSMLSKGVYVVMIRTMDGKVINRKFIK